MNMFSKFVARCSAFLAVFCLVCSCGVVQAQIFGDVDGDGVRDIDDLDLICSGVGSLCEFGPTFDPRDLDQDRCITDNDVFFFRVIYGIIDLGGNEPIMPGDGNLDGFVDGLDFIIWNQHKFTSGTTWSSGDWNCDHITDGLDFIVLNAYWYQSIFD